MEQSYQSANTAASTGTDAVASIKKTKSEGAGGSKKKSSARIENYQMMQNIGEGAFGQVNLALDKTTNKQVAIKSVSIMKTCQMNKERHVLRERDLLLTLNHPNIIRMHNCFKVSHWGLGGCIY